MPHNFVVSKELYDANGYKMGQDGMKKEVYILMDLVCFEFNSGCYHPGEG